MKHLKLIPAFVFFAVLIFSVLPYFYNWPIFQAEAATQDTPALSQQIESANVQLTNNSDSTRQSPNTLAIINDRKTKMLELMEKYPSIAARSALPDSVRNQYPDSVKQNIETIQEVDGDYEIVHSDIYQSSKSKIAYSLFVANQRIKLLYGTDIDTEQFTGTVHVKGLRLADKMVVLEASQVSPTVAPAQTTSPFKVATVLFNFQDAPQEYPITPQELDDILSKQTRSLTTFFFEASYDKKSFEGKVFDWVTIPVSRADLKVDGCQSDADFGYVTFSKARALVEQRDGSLSGYNRIIYVYPETGCPIDASGGQTGYSFANITRGVAGMSYVFQPNEMINHYAHELGHLMGSAYHANALNCWESGYLATYSDNCQVDEYGDLIDPLGSLGKVTYHYNNLIKYKYLNWLDNSSVQTIKTSGAYSIKPLESSQGTRILRIYRPYNNKNGPEYWYLEYRRPLGYFGTFSYTAFDDNYNQEANGIYIRTLPQRKDYFGNGILSASLLIKPYSDRYRYDQVFAKGSTFYDKESGISIGVTDITPNDAKIQVDMNDISALTLPGGVVCSESYGTCGCTPGTGCRDGNKTDYRCCHREMSQCVANEDGSASQVCITKYGPGKTGEGSTGDGNLCDNNQAQSCVVTSPTPTIPPYCLQPEDGIKDLQATCAPDGTITAQAFLNGQMDGGITFAVDELVKGNSLSSKCFFDSVDFGNTHRMWDARYCGTMYYNYNNDQYYKMGRPNADTTHYFNTADMRRGHYIISASVKNVRGGTCRYLFSMNQTPTLSKLDGDCDATTNHDFIIVNPTASMSGSKVKFEFGTKKVATTTYSAQVDISMQYLYEAIVAYQGGDNDNNHQPIELCKVAGNPVSSQEFYYKFDSVSGQTNLDSSKTQTNICLLRPNWLLNTTDPAYNGNKSFNFASGADPVNTITPFTFLGETKTSTFKGTAGSTYRVKAYGQNVSGGCNDKDYAYVKCPVPASANGTLDAKPNPCIIANGSTTCSTSIYYSFTNSTSGQVCVREGTALPTLVTQSLTPNFSNVYEGATWIAAGHNYVFSLHTTPTGGDCSGIKLLEKTVTASYLPLVVSNSGVTTNTAYSTWRVWATTSNLALSMGAFTTKLSYNGTEYATVTDTRVSSEAKFLAFSLPSNTGPQNCNVNNTTCIISVSITENATGRTTGSFFITLPSLTQ